MKNFSIVIFAAAASLFFIGCNNQTDSDESLGNSVIYFENASSEANIYNLSLPESKTISLNVVTDNKSSQMLTAYCKVDKDLVDAYNLANGTSYEMAPADTYELSVDKAMIPRYNTRSSSINVTVYSETLPGDESYLLPIIIDSVEGDDSASIDEENNIYYILFGTGLQSWLDRSNWEILYVSSEWGEAGGVYTDLTQMSGYAVDVLDGDEATYWGWNFNLGEDAYVPIYFVIDMKETVQLDGVRIVARLKDSIPYRVPYTFDVETSQSITGDGMSNDNEWTYFEEFTGLPEQLYNTVYLTRSQEARYLRFTLIISYNASGNTVYKGGTFAELEVLGTTL